MDRARVFWWPAKPMIEIARRKLLFAGAGSLSLLLARWCPAQALYPSKPVRLIIPFPPAQGADIFGRMLAEQLSATWGQQIIVDNRAGGAGVPAMILGKNSPADGYTLIMGTTNTLAVNVAVHTKLPYDPLKDFAPASNVVIAPLVVVAHPSFAPSTILELVNEAKRNPGTINFASAGPATAQHMTGELFKSRAGINIQHIPYKGSGPAMSDLLGGQIPLMVDSVASALPHVKGGRIKAIAVTTRQRIPQLPEVPTIAESGYPGFEGVGWAGIVLPARTPRDLVTKISFDIRSALDHPRLRQGMFDRAGIPDPRTPQEYTEFIRSEIIKWSGVAKEANVRLN
jgi:tripartite-type tricarboxylate transporter receptor subunit TctC